MTHSKLVWTEYLEADSMGERGEILVVDDEARLADLFAAWLEADWSVETAYDGAGALEAMSERTDLVLLDRRMPGRSGDEVLETLREREYDCRVVMVTAVDPDFDIVEMGFDDYLVKPISKDDLLETVDDVSTRSAYEADIREYYALVSKKALLESEKPSHELADSEAYQSLCERVDDLESQVNETVSDLSSHDDYVGAFQDLQSNN